MKHTFYTLLFILYAISASSQGYSGLIARWPFTGNANDVSGNGLNGIVHGATLTTGYTGIPNTAYQFNGISDYISVPYNSLMNSKLHSICALVKPLGFNSGPCQGNYILCRGHENISDFYGFEYCDNAYDNDCSIYSPCCDLFYGGTGNPIATGPNSEMRYTPYTAPNTWYCAVLTYDGDSTRIYINGILKSTLYYLTTYLNSSDSIAIGKSIYGPPFDYFINGVIDEVRLYDRALSPTEVTMFCDSAEANYATTINSCDSISLPDTIQACENSTITLSATIIGIDTPLSISWTPSIGLSNTSILNPLLTVGSISGWYYLTVRSSFCTTKDSVYIDIAVNDTIYNHENVSGCASAGSIALIAPSGYSSYAWNNGNTTSSISVSSYGTWWVDAFNGSCSMLVDTFHTTFISSPVVSLGNDTTICSGKSFTLKSMQPIDAQYIWSNGSNASSIVVTNSGIYSLTVTLNGCSAADSIRISQISAPVIYLGADTTVCNGANFPLQVNSDNAKYLWSDGSSGQNIDITKTGTYWATASNICGSSSDTINVTYELCDIWFPSAFTPNGDGRNDIIRVVGSLSQYKDFSLSIYNRFGQRVFYTQDIYEGWDGVLNGVKQDIGTYFYMIFYSLNGKKSMMKGDLELIR